ncbi:MAG TPA: hypothetical protein VLF21_02985 [Candidatus Saccharimonadales bacterium]|nr:hypothetical protein [Candidatus Saccharimonadales bacterium]
MQSKRAGQTDSLYFLKILIYFVVGTIWVSYRGQRVAPLGLILGLLAAQHEKFGLDRKIEYALLLVACVIGLVGIGITLVF